MTPAAMVLTSRVKAISEVDQGTVKQEIETAFEVVTNSKPELIV